MPDALELALANAASNMPKGEELHIENLDSIADPSLDEPDPNYPPYVVAPKPPEYSPRDVAFKATFATEKANAYRERMDAEYNARMEYQRRIGDGVFDYIGSLDFKVSEMNASLINLHQKVDSISTTIDTAAQSMPQEPSLKHRSLHEWDDQYLINELVERENDLMPFYYELLKRIGSPELQSLVMSSMQGKNNSMVTLAQLCSALGSMVQPQPQHHEPTAQEYPSTVMSRVPPQQAVSQQQYFGQATEEYIRQDYSATIPSMPPTYNPYFKER